MVDVVSLLEDLRDRGGEGDKEESCTATTAWGSILSQSALEARVHPAALYHCCSCNPC